jgi:D-alanyl-D-alanine carboxypeptidase
MLLLRLLICCIACLWIGSTQGAVTKDSLIAQQAQQILDGVTTDAGPGAVALIARGDKTLFRKARGRANIELGVKLAPDQVFHIASVTKMFTAALVLKFAESNKLSLADPLSRYLPDFPNAESISIRQLLNHTAGISDRAVTGNAQPGFSRRDVDIALLVGEIAKRPLNFAPGTSQAYSNSSYILLGAVIEKITGGHWYDSLQDQLLAPLMLTRTQYGTASRVINGRVAGYTSNNQKQALKNADFISMSIPASAGALVSTVDDLRNWMRVLTSGRVISAKSYQQMITPVELPGAFSANPYGFGTYIWRVRGEIMIGHTGQINGFASILAYLPSQDIIVIVLANDDNFDARSVGRRLAAIALGKPYPAVIPVSISVNEMQTLVGTYESEGSPSRTFSIKDGKLFAQRGDRSAIPLQMTRDGHLHFIPSELSYFVPVRDSMGDVVGLDYFESGDGPPKRLLRIKESAR